MEYLGLLLEVIFFSIGVYFYLFSIGKLRAGNEKAQRRIEEFRSKNGWWLRLASLALMAIMAVNIFFHVKQLLP